MPTWWFTPPITPVPGNMVPLSDLWELLQACGEQAHVCIYIKEMFFRNRNKPGGSAHL